MHAAALSLPGSRFVRAGDVTPKRLHIAIAPPVENGGQQGVLYTCKTCEGGPDTPDSVSINVTSCLFRKHSYSYQPTLEAAAGRCTRADTLTRSIWPRSAGSLPTRLRGGRENTAGGAVR